MSSEHAALVSFRADEAELDDGRDARVRARIAELTRAAPDADGRSPFAELTSLPVAAPAPWWHGRLPVAAAAVVVVVALVGAGLAARAGLGEGGSTRVGSEVPAELAARARAQPDRPLAEGERHHLRWEEGSAVAGDADRRAVGGGEWWLGADDGGQRSAWSGAVLEGGTLATGDVRTYGPVDQVGPTPFAGLSYDDLRTLPTEPRALLARVAELAAIPPGHDGVVADKVARLLALGLVPPAARQAGFEGLALLGAETGPARVDRTGRTGTTLTVPLVQGRVLVVVVDPATSAVWEVGTGPDGGAPVLDSWYTVLEQGREQP